jgi:hypothetical protein
MNYLKPIAPQQLIESKFLQKNFKVQLFRIRKLIFSFFSTLRRIRTRVFRLSSAGLIHYAIRTKLTVIYHTDPFIKVAIKSCVQKFKAQRAQLRF